ncbi:trigger factor [Prevotella brunnea]|uniref:Trigger factor n=1 Tax=Prevotella brunnea TaxID=2508867 RepID=A0A5C8GML1_9BACT|nr:trigger factor [Prevotella brunnea]MDR0186789.1 trigger factor [Prevotella brunnea]TXJ63211.1 trigger factor [Prevotella brunnea]
MKISFENPDKINGLMTLTVEEADYKDDVEKTLKDYRKRANIPGFRPGQAPMGMIKRQIGTQVKMDAINKLLGENLQKYIADNNIKMLGQPLAASGEEAVDLEKPAPYVFKFDIAVAPEFKAELTEKDSIEYYDIKVSDELIDNQVALFASRAGHYDTANEYDPEKKDMLKGDIRELDENGNTLEGGITVEAAVLMPEFIKVEDQKKLFDGAKPGDIITFNPSKAYPDNDSEVASLLKIERGETENHRGDFSYQITEISRHVNAENNKELWDSIYGEEADIKDEKQFRDTIAKGLKAQFDSDAEFKFIQDVRTYLEKKVGKLQYPDELLKRIMLTNNQEKGQEFVDKSYEASLKELTWHLIKQQLAEANNIKIEDADIRESAINSARAQFAQYGMSNVPDEYLKNYAEEILKKRENIDQFVEMALERKLSIALKKIVKLKKKSVTLDEFNALFAPKEEATPKKEKTTKSKKTAKTAKTTDAKKAE